VGAMAAADNVTSDQSKNCTRPPLADFDRSDVLFFINSLIEQNSALMGKLGQIEDLMKLAEEAVLEAAQRVEAAKEESNRIIVEAREEAERQAATTLRQAKEEAKAVVRSARGEAEGIKRAAEEEAARLLADIRSKATPEAMLMKRQAEFLLQLARAASRGSTTPKQGKTVTTEQESLYRGVANVEISPPVPVGPLNEIIRLLKHAPNIRVLSLDGTVNRGLRIRLSVERPMPLIKILASLPPVERVSAQPRTNCGARTVHGRDDHKLLSLKIRG